MATNDFQPFAYGGAANVVSQSAYLALTTILQNGFSSGVAQSAQLNKVWRQSSIMAAVLAQFSSDYSGQNSTDDGTTATLETNLIAAIRSVTKTGVILADTGAANAYTAVNVPPLVAGTWIDGVVQQVKIAHANTGASTYAPDGLTAIPIYGLGLQPLQGGELFLNGTAVLMHATIPGVNSGNPLAVLMECAGGAQQIAPATQSQHAVQLGQVGHGQCRLSVTNTTTLTLIPYNGNNLVINGVPRQIPSAGVTLSNGGLSASTLYYIYASWTGSAIQLNASATGHSTATNGIETKTGDTTQTLVGMIYTTASSQFVDSATSRSCLNWFNRRSLSGYSTSVTGSTSSGTGYVELTTNARIMLLTWADEVVDAEMVGSVTNTGINSNYSGVGIDGNFAGASQIGTSPAASSYVPVFARSVSSIAEGFHTVTGMGQVSSGTGNWTFGTQFTIRG